MKTKLEITEQEWEDLESFLSGNISPEEKDIVMKRFKNQTDFEEKLAYAKSILTGIREVELTQELKRVKLGNLPMNPDSKPAGRKNIFFIAAAAALAAFVMLFIFTDLFKNNDNKIFSNYYKPDTGLITSMSVSEQYEFDVAMIDYKAGNYQKAINGWLNLRKGNERNDTLNYFIGSSYLASNDAKSAVPYFLEVTKNQNSTFLYDAQWYAGLAYLKLGNTQKAIDHIAKSNNPKKDEILKQLKP